MSIEVVAFEIRQSYDEVDQDEEKAAGVEQAEREQQNITKKRHSSIWFSFCSKATLSFKFVCLGNCHTTQHTVSAKVRHSGEMEQGELLWMQLSK